MEFGGALDHQKDAVRSPPRTGVNGWFETNVTIYPHNPVNWVKFDRAFTVKIS